MQTLHSSNFNNAMKLNKIIFFLFACSFLLSSCIDLDKYVKYKKEDPKPPPPIVHPKDPGEQKDPTDPPGPIDITPDPEDKETIPKPDPLAIEAVVPNSGGTSGGYELRIRGQGFSENTSVLFGNIPVASVIFVSDKTLRVFPPLADFGCVDVALQKGEERVVLDDAFCYTEAAQIMEFAPNAVNEKIDVAFVLRGTGFHEPLSISIGGATPHELKIENHNTISGIIPSLALGKHDVRIVNAFGVDLLREALEILPNPKIENFYPTVLNYTVENTIKIHGSALEQANRKVFIGGREAAIIGASADTISVRAPKHAIGSYDLVLNLGLSQLRFESAIHYVEQSSDAALLTLYPAQGPLQGGNTLVIGGKNLSAQANVYFGTQQAEVVERSSHYIKLRVPSAAVAGEVVVKLGNLVHPTKYRYISEPVIDSLTPKHGPSAGGQLVTLKGKNFSPAMRVYFGSQEAQALNVVNATSASLKTPAGSGFAALSIAKDDELFNSDERYHYDANLALFALLPNSSPMIGGAKIAVTGQGFDPAMKLTLSGEDIDFEYVDTNLLHFIAPAHEAGEAELVLSHNEQSQNATLKYFRQSGVLSGAGGGTLDGNINVSVREVDSGNVIPSAVVQIGLGPNALRKAVNAEGLASFFDARLYGPQNVYACAEGYSCNTLQSVNAKIVTLFLDKERIYSDSTTPPPPPPPPPDPNDINPIEITIPYTPKPSYFVGTATGFDKVALESDPNKIKAAVVVQSQIGAYVGSNAEGDVNIVFNDKGDYKIRARSGDVALALLCGLYDKQTGSFDARFIGMKRHLFVTDDQEIKVDLECTLPLNQSLSVKLLDAPLKSGPNVVQASAFLFVGNEGYIGGFMRGSSTNDLVTINKMPPLRAALEGCYFTVITGAYTNYSNPSSVVYDYSVFPSSQTLAMGPVMGIPIFESNSIDSILSQGFLSWSIENPHNVDYYSLSIHQYTNKGSKLLWQFYAPGSASSVEFLPQELQLDDDLSYASLYVSISAYKSKRQGYDFNLFSTLDLRYNYVLSSSHNSMNFPLK